MTQPQQDPASDVGAALARLAEQTVALQRQIVRLQTEMAEQTDRSKEYIDHRFDEKDLRDAQRFAAQNEALVAFPPVAQQVGQLAVRVDGFSELMEARFVTYRTLIDSQAEKVALALTSADKETVARDAYMREAFGARDKLIQTLTERVRELELARSGVHGEQAGGQAKVSDQRASMAAWIGAATFVLAVVIVLANWLSSH